MPRRPRIKLADWHCAIHAYVLMTNHVHLLATPDRKDGIAKLMPFS